MCQRFFGITVLFYAFSISGVGAIPHTAFGLGPNGYSVISVENDGLQEGWIDIVNQTGSTATGNERDPVTLINIKKPEFQFILDPALNKASRKFNFKGKQQIACYVRGKQVNCNDVVNIIYYHPYPAVRATYWDDLQLF